MHVDGVWSPPWGNEAEVVAEFRANGGSVGRFSAPLLLLTTTGRRTGRARTCPMTYQQHEGAIFVFASKGGFPSNPDWYHNLVSNPEVVVELGTERFDGLARVLTGAEREEVFARQVAVLPMFADYQAMTDRQIPVVALDRPG